jgi:hypothetical protein
MRSDLIRVLPSVGTSACRRCGIAAENLAWILVDVVNIVHDSLFGALASSFGDAE